MNDPMNPSKRILVAEDNPALAAVVRFNLVNAGFDVTVARTGSKAWEELLHSSFDLVITDHQMPGMTGVELCRNIRGEDRLKDLPVIMLTAKSIELDKEFLEREYSVLAVFAKPFSPSAIVKVVDETLAFVR